MQCNCKWTEIIIGVVVLVVAIWPNLFGDAVSSWIIIIAAVALILHALTCKNCGKCIPESDMKMTKSKARRKRKR